MIGIVVESVDVDETLQRIAGHEQLLSTYIEQLELWQENRRQFRRDYCPNDPWSLHFLQEASKNVRFYRESINTLMDEIDELDRQLASAVLLLLLG